MKRRYLVSTFVETYRGYAIYSEPDPANGWIWYHALVNGAKQYIGACLQETEAKIDFVLGGREFGVEGQVWVAIYRGYNISVGITQDPHNIPYGGVEYHTWWEEDTKYDFSLGDTYGDCIIGTDYYFNTSLLFSPDQFFVESYKGWRIYHTNIVPTRFIAVSGVNQDTVYGSHEQTKEYRSLSDLKNYLDLNPRAFLIETYLGWDIYETADNTFYGIKETAQTVTFDSLVAVKSYIDSLEHPPDLTMLLIIGGLGVVGAVAYYLWKKKSR